MSFLGLPPELRNNIYRRVLCYDGITPEVKSAWSPWQPCPDRLRPWEPSLTMGQNPWRNLQTERSALRMQLDVMAPVREGNYVGLLPVVPASDILNLFYVCHQIYEEARSIFWAENAFIFPGQDTMHVFLHRISAESFTMIRTLGIEKTVDAKWIEPANGGMQGSWGFTDVRIHPTLQPLHMSGWAIKYEENKCLRVQEVFDWSDPSNLKRRLFQVECKTTYNWLTWPSTSEWKGVQDIFAVTGGLSHLLLTGL